MACDRFSALPDSFLTQILLYLPTKDSVKTSVLSTRWRNLWLDVPGLDLNSNDFPFHQMHLIKNFTDRYLEFNSESRLQKFKIKYDVCNVYLFGISDWIALVINRGVQHLDVSTLTPPFFKDFMPLEIYKSKTLVSLKLVNVGMEIPVFVSLPCVKTMHLEDILYHHDDPLIMEKLIAGCPVLEDLTIVRDLDDNVAVLCVKSQTLKRFCVRSSIGMRTGGVEYAVEMDAPRLKHMSVGDGQSHRILANNLSSLFKIDIDTEFNKFGSTLEGEVLTFLTAISSVRHMIMSQQTLKVLYLHLKLDLMTKFSNLCRLEAAFCDLLLQHLPAFLDSCPNLRHLILYLVDLVNPTRLKLTYVPRCLLFTLECVEIKEQITLKETEEVKAAARYTNFSGMEVVNYFLENSRVLKKLILCFSPVTKQHDSGLFNELRKLKKHSHKCQILLG